VLLAVLLVLFVACSNLANLMFARASGRRQEVGVRLALGASRGRLIRESLAESGLLAIAGGGLAILLAKILLVLIGTDVNIGAASLHVEARIDGLVLAGTVAAALLALIASGLGPALRASRTDVRAVLASGGAMVSTRWRGRRALIAVQTMTSLALLIVATACLSEVRTLSRHDTGMDLDHLAIAQIDFAAQKVDASRAREIVERVVDVIGHRPDVEAAAVSSGLPVLDTPGGIVTTDDRRSVHVQFMASTPGIFNALHVTIVRGRGFDARDSAASQPAAIISASVATNVFGNANPIGRTMMLRRRQWVGEPEPQDRRVTVVGVASDTDTGSLARRDEGSVYVPFDQESERRLVLSARSVAAPGAVAVGLRKALAAVDPTIAVQQSGIATTVLGPPNLFFEVAGTIAGMLGAFALLLALTGLYGALSHLVSGRTREIGVRLALGAGDRRIIRTVMMDGITPVVYGIVAGALLGTIVRLSMRPIFVRLFPAFDAFSFSVAPVCMLIAAAAACYLPARRASRVDPNFALRDL
jgi:predicted permease